ncbi:DUF4158 domain-containing protein [Streptomyces sp. NPDC007901]|uniref:DUF4158 domain-containing protein n=1 Tax=Streptomyces sp. NPDC007901 TaxID=3364785 RepID=UPI0036EF7226
MGESRVVQLHGGSPKRTICDRGAYPFGPGRPGRALDAVEGRAGARVRQARCDKTRLRGVAEVLYAVRPVSPGPVRAPGEAVEFVARQVQVPASELDAYEWSGRTVEYHRAQIRGHLGFRECSVADADKLTA